MASRWVPPLLAVALLIGCGKGAASPTRDLAAASAFNSAVLALVYLDAQAARAIEDGALSVDDATALVDELRRARDDLAIVRERLQNDGGMDRAAVLAALDALERVAVTLKALGVKVPGEIVSALDVARAFAARAPP